MLVQRCSDPFVLPSPQPFALPSNWDDFVWPSPDDRFTKFFPNNFVESWRTTSRGNNWSDAPRLSRGQNLAVMCLAGTIHIEARYVAHSGLSCHQFCPLDADSRKLFVIPSAVWRQVTCLTANTVFITYASARLPVTPDADVASDLPLGYRTHSSQCTNHSGF